METISLNDYLSSKSNWPRRLLGWEEFKLQRAEAHVEEEYNVDRYLPLLRDESLVTMEQCKTQEFISLGMKPDAPQFISYGEQVFRTNTNLMRQHWYDVIRSVVSKYATGRICELGCGYGYNLNLLGGRGYGGDYSDNAVALGKRLGMNVRKFNYYREEDYAFIQPGSTVLTVHSVEQIPSAESFLMNISTKRNEIKEVIHIEPCWLEERSTLLGMIRNRYNELIHHNRDLVSLLRGHPEIEILHFEADVFGLHPLNSSNVTVWRFK